MEKNVVPASPASVPHLLSLETIPMKADACFGAHKLGAPLYFSTPPNGAQQACISLPLAPGADLPLLPPRHSEVGNPCTQPTQVSWGEASHLKRHNSPKTEPGGPERKETVLRSLANLSIKFCTLPSCPVLLPPRQKCTFSRRNKIPKAWGGESFRGRAVALETLSGFSLD